MRALLEASAFMGQEQVDDHEFARFMAENQYRVFQIAYSVLRNTADAEEIAQEVFVRAHREFPSLREKSKFGPWVRRISFRLALNHQRAARRRLERDRAWHDSSLAENNSRPGVEDEAVRRLDEHEFLKRLEKAVDALPQKLRDVLLLSAVEGSTAEEAAETLDVPSGTVRSRLHQARKELLRKIQP